MAESKRALVLKYCTFFINATLGKKYLRERSCILKEAKLWRGVNEKKYFRSDD